METGTRLAVVFALAWGLLGVPLATGALPSDVESGDQRVGEIDSDDVVLAVDLHVDGSATWTVQHRVRLGDEETTQAFEELQRDVEENRSAYVDRFERRIGETVRSAEHRTGREMAVRNVSVTVEKRALPQEYGVLTYRFEWDGFAAAEDGRITAGDALAGFFLDSETRLLFSWPDGYAVTEVAPDPDENRDRRVVWIGPADFGSDEPRIVVEPTARTGGGESGGEDERSASHALLAGIVVLLVVAGGTLVRRVCRSAAEEEPESIESTEPAEEAADGDGQTVEYDETGGSEAPSALLSNEEQVLRLLENRDGRIKQQEVVQTLGWTDAKTSQVVGNLRDRGEIESFRLGRENVLVLPEVGKEDRI